MSPPTRTGPLLYEHLRARPRVDETSPRCSRPLWVGARLNREEVRALLLMSAFRPLRTFHPRAKVGQCAGPSSHYRCSCFHLAARAWPRIPDPRIVDTLEAKLSKVGCVGPMSRRERHYSFASKPSALVALLTLGAGDRWFNYHKLKISYYQAGFEEFRSRRVLHRGAQPVGADDRQFNLVFGNYDIPGRVRAAISQWSECRSSAHSPVTK